MALQVSSLTNLMCRTSDIGSSQSSRSDRVARASMKPSTYNLGSVKVTESSQFYNAKYIKGYSHVYQNGDKPQFQGGKDDGI